MNSANPQNPSSEEDVPSLKPSWLLFIEERIEEEKAADFTDEVPHQIVRDMLLAPDDEDSERIISEAVERFKQDYIDGFHKDGFGIRDRPEYNAGEELNRIANIVFELVEYVPSTDIRHDRLANLLLGIKLNAAKTCHSDHPQFIYLSWGLEVSAKESWCRFQVTGLTQDNEWQTAKQAGDTWVSTTAMLAKLYKRGLLEDGTTWIAMDLRKSLEVKVYGDAATNVGRQAQVAAVANYILIAGELFAREVKTPSQIPHIELNTTKRKLWASKFQEVADEAGEEAEYGLKGLAWEAHDKMVALLPEAFEQED